jgi:hypothetical protein
MVFVGDPVSRGVGAFVGALAGRVLGVGRSRCLHRLVPDDALVSLRAAGETLRALGREYGVAHTTLVRYFRRPEVVRELAQARRFAAAGAPVRCRLRVEANRRELRPVRRGERSAHAC